MAVPSLVLAILVVAVLGPSLTNTIVAVTIVYLPRYVRLVRASALGELNKDYVTAAKVAGVGPLRLAWSTVLPNCLAPLIVMAALGVSDAILEAAGLGFLGLGAQPPTPEWGSMLAELARIHPLRSLDRHPAGARHLDHRRRHQPRRRRSSRRARPENAAGIAKTAPPRSRLSPILVSAKVGARSIPSSRGAKRRGDPGVQDDDACLQRSGRRQRETAPGSPRRPSGSSR